MREQQYESVFGHFKGLEVGLYLNNTDCVEGVLVDVKEDHLVVAIQDQMYYVATQYIKTLSKCSKHFEKSNVTYSYINTSYLEDVVNSLKYSWITVNGFERDSHISGVLSRTYKDHILLINNSKHLYVPRNIITHLTSVMKESEIFALNEKVNWSASKISSESKNEGTSMKLETDEEESICVDLENDSVQPFKETLEELSFQDMEMKDNPLQTNNLDIVQGEDVLDEDIHTALKDLSDGRIMKTIINAADENYYFSSLPFQEMPFREPLKAINLTGESDSVNQVQHFEKNNAKKYVSNELEGRSKKKRSLKKREIKLIRMSRLDNKEQVVSSENNSSVKLDTDTSRKSRKEQNEMLEKQYFSLMKHASGHLMELDRKELCNCRNSNEQKVCSEKTLHLIANADACVTEKSLIQKQYVALIKHATKMYQQLISDKRE